MKATILPQDIENGLMLVSVFQDNLPRQKFPEYHKRHVHLCSAHYLNILVKRAKNAHAPRFRMGNYSYNSGKHHIRISFFLLPHQRMGFLWFLFVGFTVKEYFSCHVKSPFGFKKKE
jgi:hypothetical protein